MRGVAANYRLARKRSLARLQRYLHPEPADRWAEAIADLPDGNSIKVMKEIDQQPKYVRDLIHEYGLLAVAQFYNNGYQGKGLKDALKQFRTSKQTEWLNTDYLMSTPATYTSSSTRSRSSARTSKRGASGLKSSRTARSHTIL